MHGERECEREERERERKEREMLATELQISRISC